MRTTPLSTRVSFNTDHQKLLKKPDRLHKTTQTSHLDIKCHQAMEAKKLLLRAVSVVSVYSRLYSPEADNVCYRLGNGTRLVRALL